MHLWMPIRRIPKAMLTRWPRAFASITTIGGRGCTQWQLSWLVARSLLPDRRTRGDIVVGAPLTLTGSAEFRWGVRRAEVVFMRV